jgi:hypothetical protein
MPIVVRHDVAGKIVEVREAMEAAGRDPDSLELTAWQAPRDLDQLTMMRDLGVTRSVFGLPSAEPEIVIEKLDKYAGIAETLRS